MFKAIKDGKLIAISEKKEIIVHTEDGDVVQEVVGEDLFPCMVFDEVVEEVEHTCEDYEQYNGEYLLKEDIPAPTEEEQRKNREAAYTQEVDPITCHINRLADEEQTPEIEQEIAELKQERSDKVEEIKRRYPYNEE